MAPTIPITRGEITIRYVQANDHLAYVAIEKDPAVKLYVNGPTGKPDVELLGDLRRYQPTTELMAIADTTSNAFIGRCGLLHTSNDAELEIYCLLAQTHWRRGIGEVVVPFLAGLASAEGKVGVGIVDPRNQGSLALLRKLGWVSIGTVSEVGKQHGHLRYVEPRV